MSSPTSFAVESNIDEYLDHATIVKIFFLFDVQKDDICHMIHIIPDGWFNYRHQLSEHLL